MRSGSCAFFLAAGIALLPLGVVATPRLALAADKPSPLPPQIIYNYGLEDTTRSAAMGGALRAVGAGSTALFLNPADLVETRAYHIEAQAQVTPEPDRQMYGGSIIDSVTGRLAGGVAVMGGFMDPNGLNRSQLDVRLALAFPITDRFFIGLMGRYAKITQNGADAAFETSPGPFGPSDKVSGGLVDPTGGRYAFVDQLTFDAGITVKATDNLYLAVVGQNLAYAGNGILPAMVGGGIGFANKDFSVEVDGLADFDSWSKTTGRFMGGAEYLLADHVPLRLGAKYDQGWNKTSLSAGVGFIATEFSVEGSVVRSISNPGETEIVFSIAYFLESSGFTKQVQPDF